MAASRLERLKILLQADLAALPDLPLGLDESDLDQQAEVEPLIDDSKVAPMAADTNLHPRSPVNAPTPERRLQSGDTQAGRNFLRVPSDADDSEAGCILELIPGPHGDEPPLTPGHAGANLPLWQGGSASASAGLKRGQLAPSDQVFCPVHAVSKFPYRFLPQDVSEEVADKFFNAGKFWMRVWELYYVWSPQNIKPLFLITETQFDQLLHEIDSVFPHLDLRDKKEYYWDIGLVVQFPDHPLLRPRYFGRTASRADFDMAPVSAPSATFRMAGENTGKEPDGRSLEAFRKTIEECIELNKQKSRQSKAKRKEERIAQQQFMGKQFKRAQRYLGLRPKCEKGPHTMNDPPPTVQQPPAEKFNAEIPAINPSQPAPYPFERQPVFIAFDVEAWEMDHRAITEVGVSTLDTLDIVGLPPGKDGENWFSKIRHRHFRVEEHKHLVNSEHIYGCPERFEFGQSEMVSLADAAPAIASCFREPFSRNITREELDASWVEAIANADTAADSSNERESPPSKRAVVLIGQQPDGDIRYLSKLGYNPLNEPNVLEILDTATLWRVYRREAQPANLGRILYHLDMIGWNLHNAGNDAAYTLKVFLVLCVREASQRGQKELQQERQDHLLETLTERVRETIESCCVEQQGWDGDVDDDGGEAEPPGANAVGGSDAWSENRGRYDNRGAYENGRGRFGKTGNRRTFNDRVVRASRRDPRDWSPRRPAFIVDENGIVIANPELIEKMYTAGHPKEDNKVKSIHEGHNMVRGEDEKQEAKDTGTTSPEKSNESVETQAEEEDLMDLEERDESGNIDTNGDCKKDKEQHEKEETEDVNTMDASKNTVSEGDSLI